MWLGMSLSLQSGGQRSINAQIENMPVHLINRRKPESKYKYQERLRNTWCPCFLLLHAGDVEPEASDDKTAAGTERLSGPNEFEKIHSKHLSKI